MPRTVTSGLGGYLSTLTRDQILKGSKLQALMSDSVDSKREWEPHIERELRMRRFREE